MNLEELPIRLLSFGGNKLQHSFAALGYLSLRGRYAATVRTSHCILSKIPKHDVSARWLIALTPGLMIMKVKP